MMWYSIQPRDRIFVKGFGYPPFAKNMGRNIGKSISKSLSVNTVRNFLIMSDDLL